MTVKSGQAMTVLFATANATTGAAADASSTPTGTLYVNGTANGATVTVTNITTGVYKAALTLPSLNAGDVVSLRVAATVATVAGEGIVWQDAADTKRVSDLTDEVIGTGTGLTAIGDTRLANLDAAISTRYAGTPPTAGDIADAVLDEALGTHTGHIADIPTNPYTGTPPTAGDIATAAAAAILATPDNLLATDASGRVTIDTLLAEAPSVADIKAGLEANGSKLDHLWEMTEDDSGVRRLTANALERAREAMKLAPDAGVPAAGSIDALLSTTGVKLNATQGAVAFAGQVKITADVGGEGALDIYNAHASGYGQYVHGGNYAQFNNGLAVGQYNNGGTYGQYNAGNTAQRNDGVAYGQLNGGAQAIVGNITGDITGDLSGSVTGTVGGIAGTLTTIDALWAKIQRWLRLALRKDAAVATDHATELTEINANGGSGAGAYVNTTDSQEALRDTITGATGSTSKVYTVTVGGVPKAGAYCRLCTDAACTVSVSAGTSNSLGQVTFWHDLPVGTNVWVHVTLDGYEALIDAETI